MDGGMGDPHPENLDDLYVFVFGGYLAEEIGQVHRVLHNAHMERETSVAGNKFERPFAQELFLVVKGPKLVRYRLLRRTDLSCSRRLSG